jgi:hypothetical protein
MDAILKLQHRQVLDHAELVRQALVDMHTGGRSESERRRVLGRLAALERCLVRHFTTEEHRARNDPGRAGRGANGGDGRMMHRRILDRLRSVCAALDGVDAFERGVAHVLDLLREHERLEDDVIAAGPGKLGLVPVHVAGGH